MRPDEVMQSLEETKSEIIRVTSELDALLAQNEIDDMQYKILLNEKLQGKTKEELISYIDDRIAEEQEKSLKRSKGSKTRRKVLIEGTAITFVLLAFAGFLLISNGSLTGYMAATNQIQGTIVYNQTFDHYTETQLDLTNLTSLKISGVLEGTGAKVKLRIDGIDYLVANIVNPASAPGQIISMVTGDGTETPAPEYALTPDKPSYSLGETVVLEVTPDAENISFYVITGEQTQKLDANTFITQSPGEHQAVAIIVLPNDMLRLETNFTVTEEMLNGTNQTSETNQTNQTNETNTTIIPEISLPPETWINTYAFSGLCFETCNLAENSYPVIIVEPDENSSLTITSLQVVQDKENQAPVQVQVLPDITLTPEQSASLDLNKYFSDPDGDTLQYDLNNIPEINATIVGQHDLTITSEAPGQYIAYIYATDGNKLTTSNTFQIIITEATPENSTNQTTNETNQTTNNESNISSNVSSLPTDPCNNPDMNLRQSICFIGNGRKQIFENLQVNLQNNRRGTVGLFTRFGNLIIRGLLVQQYPGQPNENDFQVGYTETSGFTEARTATAWIDSETGNLYLRGQIYENQETLEPGQFNTFIIRNKFGMILGYFDELNGNLYLRGNIVQLGKI